MIVQCEKCKTKFRIADDKVVAAGVKVRCSRCAHVFVVHRTDDAGPDSGTLAQTRADLDRMLRDAGLSDKRDTKDLPSFPDRPTTNPRTGEGPPVAPLLSTAIPPATTAENEPITQTALGPPPPPRPTKLYVSPPPSHDIARALGFAAAPSLDAPEAGPTTVQANVPPEREETVREMRSQRVPSSLAREFAFDEDATAPAQAVARRLLEAGEDLPPLIPDPSKPRSSPEGLMKLKTGPDALGKAKTGPDGLGKQRTGPDALGKTKTGPDGLGRQRTGPDALGKTKTGPDGLGKHKTGPEAIRAKANADRFGPPEPREELPEWGEAPGGGGSGDMPLMSPLDTLLSQPFDSRFPTGRDGLTTPLFPPPPGLSGTQPGVISPRSSGDLGDLPGLMAKGAVGDDPFDGLDLGSGTQYSGGDLVRSDNFASQQEEPTGAKPLARIDLGRAGISGAAPAVQPTTTKVDTSLLPREPPKLSLLTADGRVGRLPTLVGLLLGLGLTVAAVLGPAGGELSNLGPDDFVALVQPRSSTPIHEVPAVRVRGAHVTTYATRGGPVLVVAGEAENVGDRELGSLDAVALVLDGDRMVAKGEAPLGVELDPGALSKITGTEDLAGAYASAPRKNDGRLGPGQRLPFMVVFPKLPADPELTAFRVEVAQAKQASR